MSRFQLPHGQAEDRPEFDTLELESVTRYELGEQRSGDTKTAPTEIPDDAVVRLELDGGFELWMRGDDLRNELARPPSRGTEGDAWQLQTGIRAPTAERGVGDWALKTLAVFGIKPQELAADKLAALAEKDNHNDLKRIDSPNAAEWTAIDSINPATTPNQDPLLLFIHGTFSSTAGSFGELFGNAATWRELQRAYPGRIYGYDHRTVSESPIENLMDLVDKLPRGATLHLISHSRGGLLGDLLSLGAAAGNPITTDELDRFETAQRQSLKARGEDSATALNDAAIRQLANVQRQSLEELGIKLATKGLTINRFVRVASPSRGTTLASGRLDRWLSVVSHLLSKVPVAGSTLGEGIQEFLLAVVKERTNPATLPGLEAMMPGSALVALLNGRPEPLPGTLTVIAGDIEGEGWWSRLKLLLPDLFFDGQHDLVVNTGSMLGGPTREQASYLLDRGEDVNHFRYFLAANTADQVVQGLTLTSPMPGFKPITADLATAEAMAPARGAIRLSGRRPVLFVLPGIMGSELSAGDDPVWMSIGSIAFGGMQRLQLPDDEDQTVTATGLIGMAYADLLKYFSDSHDLVPFAYDWRLSIEHSAEALAAALEPELERCEANGQPLCIIAHSMGGLVARAMIATRPDLWQRIRQHPHGRLLMLGTPNGGSWEIVSLLVARAAVLKKLALVDLRHSGSELLDIIGAFPGVLELLPDDDREPFTADFWSELHQQDEHSRHHWRPPGQSAGRSSAGGKAVLAAAGEVRRRLRDRAIDPDGMIYVAGQADATPCDIRPVNVEALFFGDDQQGLEVLASPRGDSSVLWDTGPLPGVPTWYMTGVKHGDLANHPDAFEALRELVVDGETLKLPQRAPLTRGSEAVFPLREHEPAFLPDQDSLLRSALGMGPPRKPPSRSSKVRVSVSHGDLATTRHTVAVGHYAGDTIIGPEAYLDRVLGGRLRRCQRLGLYPGALGSQAVFFNPRIGARPRGALMVGLGPVGALTPSDLSNTFSLALLAYSREEIERQAPGQQGDNSPPLELCLATLLIGTGAGGIGVDESVAALLRGVVRANDSLREAVQPTCVRIAEIDIIELWQDKAIQAAHALNTIDHDPELKNRLDCAATVTKRTGGQRGPRRLDDPAWWHRLQILSPSGKSMRFTSLTRRARAEQDLLATQEQMVDRFVSAAIDTTHHGRETSRTLFEMLLPNRLKDGTEMRSNLVLVLDERSARFPWEMLEDRWSDSGMPPAVERGMIRQLATLNFRDRPSMAIAPHALVIGDPHSDFVALPGAQQEAEAVQSRLRALDYRVSSEIRSDARDIVAALHRDAYQILHLAGHGVHQENIGDDPAGERVSGMIIGKGMVLTPPDINQMRRVPELVFINCCHLGRTDSTIERQPDHSNAHHLAANLAVQFIEMGVKAVVAAGWAVDDRAATTFACTFYRCLIADQPFGEAVRLARAQTWKEFPGINTWGAYQCYGDPDFTLSGNRNFGSTQSQARPYVSPSEALADLRNLRASAYSAPPNATARLRDELKGIEDRIDQANGASGQNWRQRGKLAEALGLAHGEFGDNARGVEYLNQALRAKDARACWRSVAQRATLHARWALELHHAEKKSDARDEFKNALDTIESIYPKGKTQLTNDRCWSLTAIYSRRVQTLPAAQGKGKGSLSRKSELLRLVDAYDEAADQLADGSGRDPLDPYSRLLWLTAKLMLTAYSEQVLDQLCPDFEDRCLALKQRAQHTGKTAPGFSVEATVIEVDLLLALKRGQLGAPAADKFTQDFRTALMLGVTQRQLSSLCNHLDLVHTLAAKATVNPLLFHDQAKMVARIRDAVDSEWKA